MGPVGHQRIAQRFRVATTPIEWVVPKRRGLDARSKSVLAEAAIIELSVMGAAIVAPLKWRAVQPGPYVARRSRRIGAAAATVREADLAACVRRAG